MNLKQAVGWHYVLGIPHLASKMHKYVAGTDVATRYVALPYLIDFEVGRSFRDIQIATKARTADELTKLPLTAIPFRPVAP